MTFPRGFAPALAALALALPPAFAAAAGVGEELPALSLQDANGGSHTLDDAVQRIYASGDRSGDKLLRNALAESGQPALDAQKAVVIADISGAPGFVKGFIKSSLRDRKYSTWLDLSGSTKGVLPYRDGEITVLELERRRVKAVRYAADAAALQRELAARP